MRTDVDELSRKIGIEIYSTDFEGVGGTIKDRPEDFVVAEVMPRSYSKTVWYEKRGYFHLLLIKRGIDMFRALHILSKKLGIPLNAVGYAGIKDKDAVSYQRISLPANKSVKKTIYMAYGRLKIFPLGWSSLKVYLGCHIGNSFHVKIRRLKESVSPLNEKLNCLCEAAGKKSIPNFYGLQRFGYSEPFNYQIGKALVKRNFKEALRLILKQKTLLYVKSSYIAHEKAQNDYVNRLRRLPYQYLKIFVSSYQSYLFNLMLSERLKRNPSFVEPIEGELIWLKKKKMMLVFNQRTAKKIEGLKLSEYDVYLPIIGYRTLFFQGEVKQIIDYVLSREGVKSEDFYIDEIPGVSAPGGLRRIYMEPVHFSFKVRDRDVSLFFLLPKGSYATVLLGELMKASFQNRKD